MCNLSEGIFEDGVQQGIQQGIQKGIQKGYLDAARDFFMNGATIDFIRKAMPQLTEEELKAIHDN